MLASHAVFESNKFENRRNDSSKIAFDRNAKSFRNLNVTYFIKSNAYLNEDLVWGG